MVRMLTKKEVLQIVGVHPTSQKRKEVFARLTEYDNPFNAYARYRLDEVERLVESFKPVRTPKENYE